MAAMPSLMPRARSTPPTTICTRVTSANGRSSTPVVRMMLAIKRSLTLILPQERRGSSRPTRTGGIESNDDNFVYTYYGNSDNENPLYTNIVTEGRRDFCPSTDIVNIMNTYNDPSPRRLLHEECRWHHKRHPLGHHFFGRDQLQQGQLRLQLQHV